MPTGRPALFRCYACNRKYGGLSRIPSALFESVVRTGQTRPTPTSKRGKGASRVTRQYRCGCGHVGWSSHRDLRRFPEATS